MSIKCPGTFGFASVQDFCIQTIVLGPAFIWHRASRLRLLRTVDLCAKLRNRGNLTATETIRDAATAGKPGAHDENRSAVRRSAGTRARRAPHPCRHRGRAAADHPRYPRRPRAEALRGPLADRAARPSRRSRGTRDLRARLRFAESRTA